MALVLAAVACSRQDARLQQHAESLQSLGSTTQAVVEAWLSGSVSGTYTCTALEETFRLVEQERASLATAPRNLSDPRGARLSQAAEQLSRLLARLILDVHAADASSARAHVAEVPISPGDGQ